MPDTQDKVQAPSLGRRLLRRVLVLVVVGSLFSYITTSIVSHSERAPGPSGFLRGLLNGALMPCALPNLLLGRDVTIYASDNTGRTYKLGYTAGVNGCGVLFFGISFWRLIRWRKRLSKTA